MKKWILLIAGALIVSGSAIADCGSCGTDAKETKKKAACEMKGAENKAACTMKSAEEKAACSLKGAENKAACEMKKKCGSDCKKPCCAAKAESGKKWWKFGFGK